MSTTEGNLLFRVDWWKHVKPVILHYQKQKPLFTSTSLDIQAKLVNLIDSILCISSFTSRLIFLFFYFLHIIYLSCIIISGRNYLAGNSVYTDLLFLKKYMPSVASTLHYRILDISSIKIIATDWFGTNVQIKKKKTHRSLDDIKESIQELQNYRRTIFK